MANDFPSLPSRKHAKTEEEKEEKKEEKNPQNSSTKEKAEKFRISYVHQSPLSSCLPASLLPPSHANNSEGIKMREENRCMSSRFGD